MKTIVNKHWRIQKKYSEGGTISGQRLPTVIYYNLSCGYNYQKYFSTPNRVGDDRLMVPPLTINDFASTSEKRRRRERSTSQCSREVAAAWSDTADIPSVWRHVSADVVPTSRPTSGISWRRLMANSVPSQPHSVRCIPLSVGTYFKMPINDTNREYSLSLFTVLQFAYPYGSVNLAWFRCSLWCDSMWGK